MRGGAVVARLAHNQEVAGAIPVPAINYTSRLHEIFTRIGEVRNMASYLYANYGCGCVFGDRLFGCHGKYCCSHCWHKNRAVYDARLVMGKEKVMEDNSRTIDELVAREGFTLMVRDELDRAYAKHGKDPWTRHEFYAILLEEVDELWSDIKADKSLDDVLRELVQVAAMCLRYAETGDMKDKICMMFDERE